MASQQVFGGDQVSAVVLDQGAAWTRVGWDGDDLPRQTELTQFAERDGQRMFGDDQVYLLRPNTEIANPMQDSCIANWDAVEELWDFVLRNEAAEDSPLLVTDQLWNSNDNRQRTLEYALEKRQHVAAYIAKSSVCALFSSGRPTGLVIDVGSQTASAVPIVDGFPLYRAARKSRTAGQALNRKIAGLLGEIGLKRTVEGLTPSFIDLQRQRVFDEFKESMVQVSDMPLSDASQASMRSFELPDGSTIDMGRERLILGESLVSPDPAIQDGWSLGGTTRLAIDAINSCDVDIRSSMATNVVVCGGTTLTQGFTERLNQDLSRAFPSFKIRLYASGNLGERKNASWLGGSILASLGTFHQLWVSKKEYDEVGVEQLLSKRFA